MGWVLPILTIQQEVYSYGVSECEKVANDGSRNAPGVPTNGERKAAVDVLRILPHVLGGFVFKYARGEYGFLASVEGDLSVFLETSSTSIRYSTPDGIDPLRLTSKKLTAESSDIIS